VRYGWESDEAMEKSPNMTPEKEKRKPLQACGKGKRVGAFQKNRLDWFGLQKLTERAYQYLRDTKKHEEERNEEQRPHKASAGCKRNAKVR